MVDKLKILADYFDQLPHFNPLPRAEDVGDTVSASELYQIQRRAHKDGLMTGFIFGAFFVEGGIIIAVLLCAVGSIRNDISELKRSTTVVSPLNSGSRAVFPLPDTALWPNVAPDVPGDTDRQLRTSPPRTASSPSTGHL